MEDSQEPGSGALVRLYEQSANQSGQKDLVRLAPTALEKIEDKYKNELAAKLVSNDGDVFALGSIMIYGGMAGSALFLGPLMALYLLPHLVVFGAGYGLSRKFGEKKANAIHDELHKDYRARLAEAQKQAFCDKRAAFIAAADEELTAGKLLDLRTLSYLAAIPAAQLKGASDQLAISVHQARQMIAYARCHETGPDGRKVQPRPLTFRAAQLDPADERHRVFLRDSLTKAATVLAEESNIEWQDIAMAEPEKLRTGFLRATLRGLAVFPIIKNRKKLYEIRLPEAAHAALPPLRPVENFEALLTHYENTTEKLDLPALRGWPKAKPARLTSRSLAH